MTWVERLILIGLGLAAGVLAALAHPPFGFVPGILGYALLLRLVDGLEGKGRLWRAFGYGWLAGFGYFLIGCWWVAEAFFVDAKNQAWMAPIAAVLLPSGLGVFWGAACALYRKIAPVHVGRVFVFAGIFAVFEWLRGHVLTGFPWDLPGETWLAGGAVSQWAAWLGAYGLTLLTLVMACAFSPLIGPGNRKYRAGMATLGLVLLAVMWIAGALRLGGARRVPMTTTAVRVVQADVPQESKWTPAQFADILHRYVNLTSRSGEHDPDVIVWPEGALPASAEDTLDPNEWVEPAIAGALTPNQTLLMGTARAKVQKGGPTLYYNSLYAIRNAGAGLKVEAVYDKYRLVPFGEYLPAEKLMTAVGFKALTHIADSFSPGPRPRPLTLRGLPQVQPLICYESLFPGLAADGKGRPGWIVNVSNDAWFGRTSGPLQHLNLASYRAIEQGLPLVRATPTGVSAVIDPWGRVLPGKRLNPGESGAIDALLPAPAPATLYSRTGDFVFWILALVCFAPAVRRSWLRSKTS